MLVSNPVTYDPRVRIEAESLTGRDNRVTVIGWDRASEFIPEEKMNGASVLRLRNTGYMNLLRFDLLRLRPWWRMAYDHALKLHRKHPLHVVHCHDLDTLPTGVWLKKNLGVPLIYDAHEIWGYMVSRDLPEFLANRYLRKEKRLVKHVDAVITVNEPLKEYFEGMGSAPVAVVMNAKPIVTRKYIQPRNDLFTVIYIGTLNDSRFVKELAGAVRDLEGVRLILAGIGKPSYVTVLEEMCGRIPNVRFMGRIPQEEVLPLTLKSDAVACFTDPSDKNNSMAMTNKQFEAMACGRPIVVSRDTYLAEFTERHGIGLAVDYSIEGVREGIRRLRDDSDLCETLGRRALEKAITEFNWEIQEEELFAVYDSIQVRNDST